MEKPDIPYTQWVTTSGVSVRGNPPFTPRLNQLARRSRTDQERTPEANVGRTISEWKLSGGKHHGANGLHRGKSILPGDQSSA